MPSTLTYTGTTGPGMTLTTQVFNDVTEYTFKVDRKVLMITWGIPSQISHLSLLPGQTITHTLVGGNHTVTVAA